MLFLTLDERIDKVLDEVMDLCNDNPFGLDGLAFDRHEILNKKLNKLLEWRMNEEAQKNVA